MLRYALWAAEDRTNGQGCAILQPRIWTHRPDRTPASLHLIRDDPTPAPFGCYYQFISLYFLDISSFSTKVQTKDRETHSASIFDVFEALNEYDEEEANMDEAPPSAPEAAELATAPCFGLRLDKGADSMMFSVCMRGSCGQVRARLRRAVTAVGSFQASRQPSLLWIPLCALTLISLWMMLWV